MGKQGAVEEQEHEATESGYTMAKQPSEANSRNQEDKQSESVHHTTMLNGWKGQGGGSGVGKQKAKMEQSNEAG